MLIKFDFGLSGGHVIFIDSIFTFSTPFLTYQKKIPPRTPHKHQPSLTTPVDQVQVVLAFLGKSHLMKPQSDGFSGGEGCR